MIIWLASFPRSGNTYFRMISSELFNLETYSIYDEKRAPVDSAGLQRMIHDKASYLVKTHEMPGDSHPAIYLVRDGRDVLVSFTWYRLTRAKPSRQVPDDEFRSALRRQILSTNYGGWSANILAWIKRPEGAHVVRFEEFDCSPRRDCRQYFQSLQSGF